MTITARQSEDDLQPKIQSLIGNLSFIIEYFEANDVNLPNLKPESLEYSLKGMVSELEDMESKLEEAHEFKLLFKKDLELASDGHLPINSLSSSKIIDMYLDNIESDFDLSTKMTNDKKIKIVMMQNREERRNRLRSVDEDKAKV